MDGDGCYDNPYSPMATVEPHADPELPQPASPEAALVVELLAAILARGVPPTLPSGPTVYMNHLVAWRDEGDQGNWNGNVVDDGVGADDDTYAYGGFGAVPASGDAVAALAETTVQTEGEAAAAEECAVCLECYEAGDALRKMPCAHAFHEHCIFGWLAVSRLCPLCRFALPAEVDSDAEDEDEDDDDNGDTEDDDDHDDDL
ncbi:unnamed protein product [Urochloa humidicola]